MSHLSIDQKKCAGCGYCSTCIPNLFKFDIKKFKAKIKQKGKLLTSSSINISANQQKKIIEVVKGCPAQAIKLSK